MLKCSCCTVLVSILLQGIWHSAASQRGGEGVVGQSNQAGRGARHQGKLTVMSFNYKATRSRKFYSGSSSQSALVASQPICCRSTLGNRTARAETHSVACSASTLRLCVLLATCSHKDAASEMFANRPTPSCAKLADQNNNNMHHWVVACSAIELSGMCVALLPLLCSLTESV